MNATVPTEHEEQREFIKRFRRGFPGVLVFAIPNGGYRSKSLAGKLKAEGVTRGVPDLFVPAWELFIEMKRQKGGSLSADQKEIIAYLSEVGYRCIVTKGCDDAFRQLEGLGYSPDE